MPKKKGRKSITVSSEVWDDVFDRKIALEALKREDVGMGKAIEDLLAIRHIAEFVYWFELNCEKMGFTKIFDYSVGLHPCFFVEQDGRRLCVALELRSSDFPKVLQESESIDLIICLENDTKLSIPTITADLVEFQKKIPLTLFISKQLNAQIRKHKKFDWVKFLVETIRDKIKELNKKGEK